MANSKFVAKNMKLRAWYNFGKNDCNLIIGGDMLDNYIFTKNLLLDKLKSICLVLVCWIEYAKTGTMLKLWHQTTSGLGSCMFRSLSKEEIHASSAVRWARLLYSVLVLNHESVLLSRLPRNQVWAKINTESRCGPSVIKIWLPISNTKSFPDHRTFEACFITNPESKEPAEYLRIRLTAC